MANGLGGPIQAFHPHFRALRGQFRVLSWDYRGTYGSTLHGHSPNLSLSTHAEDFRAIAAAAGVTEARFVGWSMGVQVALEIIRNAPDFVTHLVCMNGTFGQPLHGVAIPFSGQLLPSLVRGAGKLHFLGRPFADGMSRSRLSVPLLLRLGMISKAMDRAHLVELLECFRALNFDLYFKMLSSLGEHDAIDVLSKLRMPTLVITGSRDFLTPAGAARKMQKLVPHSELFVIEGGTHYAPSEYPDVVVARVLAFLEQNSPPVAAVR